MSPRRSGSDAGSVIRRCPPAGSEPSTRTRCGHWTFSFDVTTDGRILKLLKIVDEHTREALEIVVNRRIDADTTVATLDRIVAARRTAPEFIRCDNGPELTANAPKDWCRFTGVGSSYIEPGSPWKNPWVESFGSRLRDELLACEQFDALIEAQVVIGDWKEDYNHKRPHSRLGWKPPAVYAAGLSPDTPTRLS